MGKLTLKDISIAEYCDILKAGVDVVTLKEINDLLTKALGDLGVGFDLDVFMMQKDLLLLQCRQAIAILDFNGEQVAFLDERIKAIKKELAGKEKKTENKDPYKSFLSWILAVEKYLGFSIDRSNDLLYFTEATIQMLKHFESQKRQIDESKASKR
jgi:hypothetical protein